MAQFSYKAKRRSGEVVTGLLEVADRGAALIQIERLGLFPLAVDAAKGGAVAAKSTATKRSFTDALPPTFKKWATRPRKPKLQELATFTHQLANLLQAGMPLTVALNSMQHLESKGIPKSVSAELRQEVMEGRSLSDAMAKQPLIFSDLYINMVKAGEQSGALVDVLRRMGNHFQQVAEVKNKVTTAMIYPLMVCLVGVGLILFFIYFMLPKFTEMFKGFNVELPLPTKLLIGVGKLMTNPWYLIPILLFFVAAFIIFMRYKATEDGSRRVDQWRLKIPIIGKVVQLSLFGQFARTLSTLLENGVPVLTALKITEQVITNTLLRDAIAKTRWAIEW